jgi:ZIP family zinc transporter
MDLDHSISILGRVVLAFGLALAGGALSLAVGVSHRRLCALISLAAGTLLGVTVFSIVPECAHVLGWWQLILALGSGYVVFVVISKYVYHVCPACAASHFDEATTHRFSEIASALIVALTVHSTMDGLAVAAGHEHGGETDLTMLLAVCVHKIPEGLALGALLLGSGHSRGRALVWVAAVEATTILGGVIGLVAFPHHEHAHHLWWLAAVLAHAGGGFVFLATHAVLGELLKHGKALVLTNFGAGLAIIGALAWAAHAW